MFSEYTYASFSDAYFDGEKIWFSNHTFNGLFTYSLKGKKTVFHGKFPGFDEYETLMHKKVVKCGNDLVFFPNKEFTGVHIYSELTQEITFCNTGIRNKAKKEFVADFIIFEKKCLIFFKNFLAGIYEYDFEKRTFSAHQEFFSDIIEQNIICPEDSILRLFCQDNVVWIPINGKNLIIKYSLLNKKFETVNLAKDIQIADVIVCNDELIITQINKSEVLKGKDGVFKSYQIADLPLKEEIMPPYDKWAVYSRIISVGTEIILLPRCAKEILRLDHSNESVVTIKIDKNDYKLFSTLRKNWPAYYGYFQYKDGVFLYPCAGNLAIRINYELDDIIMEAIRMDGIDYTEKIIEGIKSKKIMKSLGRKVVLKESSDFATINDYIKVIKAI